MKEILKKDKTAQINSTKVQIFENSLTTANTSSQRYERF